MEISTRVYDVLLGSSGVHCGGEEVRLGGCFREIQGSRGLLRMRPLGMDLLSLFLFLPTAPFSLPTF